MCIFSGAHVMNWLRPDPTQLVKLLDDGCRVGAFAYALRIFNPALEK